MYELTLSKAERDAIDWVGHRYSNGTYLYKLLWVACTQTPDDVDWDHDGDITFHIPERVAWEIMEIPNNEGCWPCFSPAFSDKMFLFISEIV